ncbi:hypothetical protein SJDPG5_07345 [Porphyromonas gingivalis SJD5]|nr:hypothetical protein SJDPG5_07345 [Porphyromonas gingivalis SJD5]
MIKTDISIDLTKKGVLHAVSANLKYNYCHSSAGKMLGFGM